MKMNENKPRYLETLDYYILCNIFQYLELADVYQMETYVSSTFKYAANYYYRYSVSNCNYPSTFRRLNLTTILKKMGEFITSLTVEYFDGIKINDQNILKTYCPNIIHLKMLIGTRDDTDTETITTDCSSSCSSGSESESEVDATNCSEYSYECDTKMNPPEMLQLIGLKSISICSLNEVTNLTDDIILNCILPSHRTLESIVLIGIGQITGSCLYELPVNLKSLTLKWLTNLKADILMNWNKNNHNLENFENIVMDSSVVVQSGDDDVSQLQWECLENFSSFKLTSTLCQSIKMSTVFRNISCFEYVMRIFDEKDTISNVLMQLACCPKLKVLKIVGCAALFLKDVVLQPNARQTIRKFINLETVFFINCPFICNRVLNDLSHLSSLRELHFSLTKKLRDDNIIDFLLSVKKLRVLTIQHCMILVTMDKRLTNILQSLGTFDGKNRKIQIFKIHGRPIWTGIEVRQTQYEFSEMEVAARDTGKLRICYK